MGIVRTNNFLRSPTPFFATLAAASLATLLAIYFLQLFHNLPPCILCVYQRIPYWLTVCICAVGWFLCRTNIGNQLSKVLIGLSGAALLVGTGLAGYHVGVEYGLWQGTKECSALGVDATTLSELTSAILSAPLATCADVLWSFMGLSLAGWNLLWSLFLALLCACVLKSLR